MSGGLEDAVETLAKALDALETRLDARIGEADEGGEAHAHARRQARVARVHADVAARELATSIAELKSIIADDGAPAAKG